MFLDVFVKNRFMQDENDIPVVSVKMLKEVNVDLCLYTDFGQLISVHKSAGVKKHHSFALEELCQCPEGLYQYWMIAYGDDGRTESYYPVKPEGGAAIRNILAELDAGERTVKYFLPQSAIACVRAGIVDGPYLEPIASWTMKRAGRHELFWDGKVEGTVVDNLYGNENCKLYITAISLPVNAICKGERIQRDVDSEQNVSECTTVESGKDYPWEDDHFRDKIDAKMQQWLMGDFSLTIEAKGMGRVVNAKIGGSHADYLRLSRVRFELMLFIDDVFFMEDEQAQLPFNIPLNTSGLSKGRHVLTVNVVDADGCMGTASQIIEVK